MNHQQAAEKIIGEFLRTADLFPDDLANARRSDPITSKISAIRYNSKRRGADKELMKNLIDQFPGHTAAEYSAILITKGVPWYRAARMTTKRISDIRHEIKKGNIRLCEITGELAATYYPLSQEAVA